MFKSRFVLSVLLIGGSLLAYSAIAIDAPLPLAKGFDDSSFTLEGKITEHTAGKLTVSTTENIIFHVVYNANTQIKKKDGSVGAGTDFHIGQMISVAGDLADSGEISAKTIDIETETAK